jgi:aspartate kinase
MCFEEAAELAYFGSRVLHPATLLPAMEREIPVRVLNTNRPDHPGTRIDHDGEVDHQGFTSVAYKENQVVLAITSPKMFQQVGYLAAIFDVLARHGVVVDVVATSEIRVCLTTDRRGPVEEALPELAQFGACELRTGKTILAVVARQLARRREQVAEVIQAVTRSGAQIEMLSFGLESINLSLVIDDRDVAQVVPLLHRRLL